MDILYTVGPGSKFGNQELKWSLRSVEKFGRNVGKIVVAGVIPDFLNDEIIKVPVKQTSWLFNKNMFANVLAAVDSGAVTGDFLLSADDHFFVKEVNLETIPTYYAGDLPTIVTPETPNKEYVMGLVFSRWLLGMCGLATFNTSCHNDIPVSAPSIRKFARIVNAAKDSEYRMNTWALLGNMFLAEHPEARIAPRRDIKIVEVLQKRRDIVKRIGDSDCFSIGDAAFASHAFVNYMEELFPEKSRWER